MSKNTRIIFHIDMNSFYASVEMAYNPQLKGKPLAIAGNPEERKGIIVTSSYEARAKGVKTTMPLWQAKKLCPELIVMRPNFDRYRRASKQIFQLLAEFTPMIQPVSIDEGYMDITNYRGHPVKLAYTIQQLILDKLDLPASIGIGPNKFLAKMASDMKKPLGITILRRRDLPEKLWPMPVAEMYGVGKKTAEKLHKIKIFTIGDLAKADEYQLSYLLGINGERLKNRANGIDPRVVNPDAVNEFKSIGNSKTLPHDTVDETEIIQLLNQLAKKVSDRLSRRELAGLTVQITIRYADRKTITRSKKLDKYIENEKELFSIAYELFQQNWNTTPIRLLGIAMQDLKEKDQIVHQLDLFTYEQEIKQSNLDLSIDQLTKKYGENTFKQFEQGEQKDNLLHTSFQKDFLDDYKKNK